MNEYIEFIKMGASLGIGFYIGFEGMKAITSTISKILSWILWKIDDVIERISQITREDK